ncbi:MAG: hypothetical protein U9Q92_01695 [archaeon]|nr:hypothetical protein [archaeon]
MIEIKNGVCKTRDLDNETEDQLLVNSLLENYYPEKNEYKQYMDGILTQLRTERIRNRYLMEIVNKFEEKRLNDNIAEQEIRNYLKRKKIVGMSKINILDIMEDLRLPAEQINRIMNKLKSEGIQEVD